MVSAEVTAVSGLGVIVKRCGCLEPGTRRRLGRRCGRLPERGHGSWYFHCSVTTMFGRRERVRRGGYGTRREAEAARDELLERSRAERTTATWTVARWLRYWLSTRTRIRPSTLRSYTEHVERHLIPHLGRIRLGELTGRDVTAMFATLSTTDTRFGRPPTPATLHRIRATLRSALNAAIRDGLLRDNPARHVELPTPRRPQPQVWTDNRVDAWRRGEVRPVGGGVDGPAAGRVLRLRAGGPAVRDVVADRPARTTPRRGGRPALDRRRPRPTRGDDRPAAHRLRPHRRRRTTQDPSQPTHHRPRPYDRPAAARPSAPATHRSEGRRRHVARHRLRVHHTRRRRRCTRTGSPAGSAASSSCPDCRRCGCTTCATARRPWPTPPAPT